MTALLGELAAERHFSWHAECEKRERKVHIKHGISSHALRHAQRDALPQAHDLSAARSERRFKPLWKHIMKMNYVISGSEHSICKNCTHSGFSELLHHCG